MSDPIVSFDEAAMRGELRELVRRTVEDTLNALLEEEADDLVRADRYERTADREAYRAGHYERGLTTTSGQVILKMPKLKGMRFATAVIERYRRREASVEEAMIEAIHAQESLDASMGKAAAVAAVLEEMRLKEAAECVRDGVAETLTYYTRFPMRHWRRIRTNNAIERLNREIRRRTRAVGTFPDGKSALMLVTARLKYVADSEWGSRRYLDVSLLDE